MDNESARLIRKIAGELAAIQQTLRAIIDQSRPSRDHQEPPRTVDVSLVPPVHDYYASEEKDRPTRNKRERNRLILESVTLAAAIAAATFTAFTLTEVHKQTPKIADSAAAAKSAAEIAAKQLELSERPWIYAKPAVTGPFTFTERDGGARFDFVVGMKNIGHSLAKYVHVRADLVFVGTPKDFMFRAVVNRQKEICERERTAKDPELAETLAMFPTEEIPMPMAVSASKSDMLANRIPFRDRAGDWISPVLVGCVDYQFTFSTVHHQTSFAYNIYRTDPNMPSLGLTIQIGNDVPVTSLRLETYFFGGNGAD